MPDDPWDLQEITETVAAVGLTSGVDSQLPDEVRFVRAVKETLSAVVQKFGIGAEPSVFLLGERPDQHASLPAEPRFFVGTVNPAGRMWFGGAAARQMAPVSLPSADAKDIIPMIVEMGFGGSTAIYYDPAAPADQAITVYPYGVADTERVLLGPIAVPDDVAFDDIVQQVDGIHGHVLKTPFHQRPEYNLWANPDQWDAQSDAEARVESVLLFGLSVIYSKPFFLQKQISGQSGRYDISLHQSLPAKGHTVTHAIIELKVIKSFGSTHNPYSHADCVADLKSGLDQAAGYVQEHNPIAIACFYFDMRRHDHYGAIGPAAAHSQAIGIPLRGWRCLPNAQAYQVHAAQESAAALGGEAQ